MEYRKIITLNKKSFMQKLIIIFLILFAGIASAQINLKNPIGVSLNGGFYIPYSSETQKTGVCIGIDLQHKIEPIYMFFNLTYNFSSRKNNLSSEYFNNTSSTGLLEMSVGPRLYINNEKMKYFIDGGLGLYMEKKGSYEIKVNGVTTTYPSESNTSLGGNFSFGCEYPISDDIKIVGRVKYHLYFGVGDSPFLNTYFGLLGGIKYNIKF
jgi:hypothetical protein